MEEIRACVSKASLCIPSVDYRYLRWLNGLQREESVRLPNKPGAFIERCLMLQEGRREKETYQSERSRYTYSVRCDDQFKRPYLFCT